MGVYLENCREMNEQLLRQLAAVRTELGLWRMASLLQTAALIAIILITLFK